MKKTILLCYIFIATNIFFACNNTKSVSDGNKQFGSKFEPKSALTVAELSSKMSGNSGKLNTQIEGKVSSVCQKKGCWMTIDVPNGESMRITFKDYAFFMPKDIVGKTVVAQGFAYFDTTTVDMLRHYAEDEGKPAEEIAKITEPKLALAFEADGVIIK